MDAPGFDGFLFRSALHPMNSVIRQVCRNVKRWRNAKMALRWTAAGMLEAAKGLRRLNARKQLPILKAALHRHGAGSGDSNQVDNMAQAA